MNMRNVRQVNLRIIKEIPQSILEVCVIAVQITIFSVFFFTQPLEHTLQNRFYLFEKTTDE